MLGEPPPPSPRWLPALVLALVAITYLPAAGGGFVWDDVPLVVQNGATGDLRNLPRFFTMDLWAATPGQDGGTGYYRPLMLVSLALERAAYGLWPGGHHLQNIAWHVAATAGLMALARPRVGGWGAAIAGLVFGLHPMQSEAVIWVAARNDPMATALGLWALERASAAAPGRRRQLVAFLLTVLAGLAKESVLLLPGLLLALDLMQRRRPRFARLLPVVAGIGVVLGLRVAVGVDGAGLPQEAGWALLAREAHRFGGLLLTRAAVPWPLHNGASLEWLSALPTWRWAVGWGALAVVSVACGLRARRGDLRPAAGLAWFVLAVAPIVIPVADKGLIGERYLYLALAGLGLGLGAGAGPRRAALAGLLAGPAILAIQLRIPDWQDDRSLWEAAVRAHATPYTLGGLGLVRLGEEDVAGAYGLFVRALDDPRPDPSVCTPALRAAARLGRAGLLVQTGAWAARRGCGGALFRGERGQGLVRAGEWGAARAVAADPGPRVSSGVVLDAAIATWDGDADGLEAARAHPAAPADLTAQVEALLDGPRRARMPAGGPP